MSGNPSKDVESTIKHTPGKSKRRARRLDQHLSVAVAAALVLATTGWPKVLSAQSGQINCDMPFNGTIADPLVSNLLSFSVADQEIVALTVVPGMGSSLAPVWRLLDQTGSTVTGSCGVYNAYNTHGTSADCGPLPATGNPYSIDVASGSGTGSYEAYLQRLTAPAACDTTALPCAVPLSRDLTDPVDTDLLSFSVADQEIVTITVVPGTELAPVWRLLDKTGSAVNGSCGGYNDYNTHGTSTDCGPLPATGNPYSIDVASGSGTGSYEVYLQRLIAAAACDTTALPCAVPLSRDLTDPVDTDLLSFSVADQEIVTITVLGTGSSLAPVWRLLDKTGSPVTGNCGMYNAYNTHDTSASCGPLPATGNPYSTEVASGSGTGSFQAVLTFPSEGCPLQVTATGTCMQPGPQGLIPCTAGTVVTAYLCTDQSCAASALITLGTTQTDANGQFSFVFDGGQVAGKRLVFDATIVPGASAQASRSRPQAAGDTAVDYRIIDFGPVGAVTSLDVMIDPSSEAATLLLEQEGLPNFTEAGIQKVNDAVRTANQDVTFAGQSAAAAVTLATQTASTTPAVQQAVQSARTCAVGDCNQDRQVTADELLTMVNIALGNSDLSTCTIGDVNADGQITVDEILTAVNNALNGCGGG